MKEEHIRYTKEEKEKIKKLAEENGLSIKEYLRRASLKSSISIELDL